MPDQTTAPPAPAEVAHSGADVLAPLLTGPPPQHVALAVKDYTLGALDFAKPQLTPSVTPLQAQDYTLQPLDFSTPSWALFMGPACVTVTWDPEGRPRHIPDDIKDRMIADLVAQLPSIHKATHWKQPTRKDPAIKNFVRELANRAGINTSDYTLERQISAPALRIWRSKR
jgi:hypothetical protein